MGFFFQMRILLHIFLFSFIKYWCRKDTVWSQFLIFKRKKAILLKEDFFYMVFFFLGYKNYINFFFGIFYKWECLDMKIEFWLNFILHFPYFIYIFFSFTSNPSSRVSELEMVMMFVLTSSTLMLSKNSLKVEKVFSIFFFY